MTWSQRLLRLPPVGLWPATIPRLSALMMQCCVVYDSEPEAAEMASSRLVACHHSQNVSLHDAVLRGVYIVARGCCQQIQVKVVSRQLSSGYMSSNCCHQKVSSHYQLSKIAPDSRYECIFAASSV